MSSLTQSKPSLHQLPAKPQVRVTPHDEERRERELRHVVVLGYN